MHIFATVCNTEISVIKIWLLLTVVRVYTLHLLTDLLT